MEEPRGVCLDPKGNIVVSTKTAIVYLDLEKQVSSLLAGDPCLFGFKDGPSLSALFDHPDGILYLFSPGPSPSSLLLVSDTYNHRLRVLDLTTRKVSTLCGSTDPGHVDGPCKDAKLNFP